MFYFRFAEVIFCPCWSNCVCWCVSSRLMGRALCGVWTPNTDPIWSKPWRNSTFPQPTPSARPLLPHPGNTHTFTRVQTNGDALANVWCMHANRPCSTHLLWKSGSVVIWLSSHHKCLDSWSCFMSYCLSLCVCVCLSDSAFSPARHLFLQGCSLKGEPSLFFKLNVCQNLYQFEILLVTEQIKACMFQCAWKRLSLVIWLSFESLRTLPVSLGKPVLHITPTWFLVISHDHSSPLFQHFHVQGSHTFFFIFVFVYLFSIFLMYCIYFYLFYYVYLFLICLFYFLFYYICFFFFVFFLIIRSYTHFSSFKTMETHWSQSMRTLWFLFVVLM